MEYALGFLKFVLLNADFALVLDIESTWGKVRYYVGLSRLLFLIKHLNLSGVWSGVDLRTDLKKDMCLKDIELRAQNMLTNLGSIFSMIGGPIWPFNAHNNLYFDNEYDINMSSKKYEEKWLRHMDLSLIISH